jgi:hypothetical protein
MSNERWLAPEAHREVSPTVKRWVTIKKDAERWRRDALSEGIFGIEFHAVNAWVRAGTEMLTLPGRFFTTQPSLCHVPACAMARKRKSPFRSCL